MSSEATRIGIGGAPQVTVGEKISALQNIILEHANSKRTVMVANAREEAAVWITKELGKLDKEADAVLSDAKVRSDDICRRQIMTAERERATEALKLQYRLLQEAQKRFKEGLVRLRERDDYTEIIAAIALSSARLLADSAPLKLRLASIDAGIGDEVAARVNKRMPDANMSFDPEPVPIIGGCWVESGDGRRQINADWQSRTQETADVLAERLLEHL